MRIGLDLDNTIVCYDALFHTVALERGLIAAEVAPDKNAVRQFVRQQHGDEAWTRLQGEIYGPRLAHAEPFPGVEEFVRHCRTAGIRVCIVSHKSRVAARGTPHDLRAAALRWLAQRGWFAADRIGLSPDDVEFHDTRAAKVAAICRRACDYFVDDLPEVFLEPGFPRHTTPVLFDPARTHPSRGEWKHASSWSDIEAAILAAVPA